MECGRESEFIRFLERIHEVHSVERKPPEGYVWSRRDWQKFKEPPDLTMCGLKYGLKLEKPLTRERTRMVNEKPKLDNARRLKGICFIDPEGGEFKETIKNATRKLEVHVDAAFQVTSFIVMTMNLEFTCMWNRASFGLVLLSHFFCLLLCCFPPLPLWVVLSIHFL